MKLNLNPVEFSPVDIIQSIKVPKKLDENLSYYCGIHMGDGSMNIYNNDYVICISGHLIDEIDWYEDNLIPLVESLFNKKVSLRKELRKKRNCIRLQFRSKAVVTFLERVIGMPLGAKDKCNVPKNILEGETFAKNFLRGIADTDFSLSFKKRHKRLNYYPTISFGTNNLNLFKDVEFILNDLNFSFTSLYNLKTKRKGKILVKHQLDLNGVENLSKWMDLIGFGSPKHLTKYKVWKKFGFCPPYTNINQRKSILNEGLDPYSFY